MQELSKVAVGLTPENEHRERMQKRGINDICDGPDQLQQPKRRRSEGSDSDSDRDSTAQKSTLCAIQASRTYSSPEHRSVSPLFSSPPPMPSTGSISTPDGNKTLRVDDLVSATESQMSLNAANNNPFQTVSSEPLDVANNTKTMRRFDAFPTHIKVQIFRYALNLDVIYWPTYQAGTLFQGIRATVDGRNTYTAPKVDLPHMKISKDVSTICSTMVYGANQFCFDNPAICKWWIKRIGPANLANVRFLTLFMHSGWEVDGPHRTVFDLSHEEGWLQVLCLINTKHRLSRLEIDLVGWDAIEFDTSVPKADWHELIDRRTQLTERIAEFRGIPHADVRDRSTRWLNRKDMRDLSMLLAQPRTNQNQRPEYKGLAELIEEINYVRQNY